MFVIYICCDLPRSILRSVPAAIRIIVLNDAWFFLNDFCSCTTACHCRAQENIYNEHDKEHNAKCYAEV